MIPNETPLLTTALDGLHRALGARMAPFAGYAMPVHYPCGILAEHHWTRQCASLFDVSHMGQIGLCGREGADPAAALERLVPGDLQGLKPGRTRYTVLTNAAGGILDDLMVTRQARGLFLVVNAACKRQDLRYFNENLPECAAIEATGRALLALQGPAAADILEARIEGVKKLAFLAGGDFFWNGAPVFLTRSGYTGEDGFEISLPEALAEAFAQTLLADPRVKPAGLGARDSLRLEAGLCLYGHDLTAETSPIEAGLAWTISQRRRREGGFPGAAAIQRQLREGAPLCRVGLRPEGRAPIREGAEIYADAAMREALGKVTSGGFSPTLKAPIAMGYVKVMPAGLEKSLFLNLRGKPVPASIVQLPFVPHRYVR